MVSRGELCFQNHRKMNGPQSSRCVTECMNLITIVFVSDYDFMYVTEHCAELYTLMLLLNVHT